MKTWLQAAGIGVGVVAGILGIGVGILWFCTHVTPLSLGALAGVVILAVVGWFTWLAHETLEARKRWRN